MKLQRAICLSLFPLSLYAGLPLMASIFSRGNSHFLQFLFVVFLAPPLIFSQEARLGEGYAKALAYYEQGDFDACLNALKSAIDDSVKKPDLRILAAHCHAAKKNYREAAQHLHAVIENFPNEAGVKEDLVQLLVAQGKYRQARKVALEYKDELEENEKAVPENLFLLLAKAALGSGKPSEALSYARQAKQSADDVIKYGGVLTETRSLIALGHFDEAEIGLSYAKSMRSTNETELLHALLQEARWRKDNAPDESRAEIAALYEKLRHSKDDAVRQAATQNLKRVQSAGAR